MILDLLNKFLYLYCRSNFQRATILNKVYKHCLFQTGYDVRSLRINDDYCDASVTLADKYFIQTLLSGPVLFSLEHHTGTNPV